MNLPDFRKAFRDDETFRSELFGKFRVSTRTVGRLTVTTGRIVACDPLVFPERQPFRRKVPPGRYPVVVSIAHFRNDQRIACAMLRLTRRVPVRWEMAVVPGQNIRKLGSDEFYGYAVDAGVGCFMDKAAATVLLRKMRADPDYFNELIDASNESYVHTRRWADFPLDTKTKLNVVFFSSGMGDGVYPSYWGFDRAGELACLVTDFDVLDRVSLFTTLVEKG